MRCLISKTTESEPFTPHDVFWVGVAFCTIGWVACSRKSQEWPSAFNNLSGNIVSRTCSLSAKPSLDPDPLPTTACLGKGGFPGLAGITSYGKIHVEQEMRWWCPDRTWARHWHPAGDRYLRIKQQKTDMLLSVCLPGAQETKEGRLSRTWDPHSHISMPASK